MKRKFLFLIGLLLLVFLLLGAFTFFAREKSGEGPRYDSNQQETLPEEDNEVSEGIVHTVKRVFYNYIIFPENSLQEEFFFSSYGSDFHAIIVSAEELTITFVDLTGETVVIYYDGIWIDSVYTIDIFYDSNLEDSFSTEFRDWFYLNSYISTPHAGGSN